MWIGEEGERKASSERRVVKREGGREGGSCVERLVRCSRGGRGTVSNIYNAVGLNSTAQHSIKGYDIPRESSSLHGTGGMD